MSRGQDGGQKPAPPLRSSSGTAVDQKIPEFEDADATRQERLDVVMAEVAKAQAAAAAQAQAQAQAPQAQANAAASQEVPTYNETLIQRNPTESGMLADPEIPAGATTIGPLTIPGLDLGPQPGPMPGAGPTAVQEMKLDVMPGAGATAVQEMKLDLMPGAGATAVSAMVLPQDATVPRHDPAHHDVAHHDVVHHDESPADATVPHLHLDQIPGLPPLSTTQELSVTAPPADAHVVDHESEGATQILTSSALIPNLQPSPGVVSEVKRIQAAGEVKGQPFGRYTLLGRVGSGGMAEVRLAYWIAADGKTRPCVVKKIVPSFVHNEQYRALFNEEIRLSRLLRHPNIVQHLDSGEVEDVPFIAFELIDGMTVQHLDGLIAPDTLPVSIVLEIGVQVAAALAYAHGLTKPDGMPLGVVHRDVSPQNVLLSRDGEVKLADFGIARFRGRGIETGIGPPRGKLRYMPPEQIHPGPVDGRADIFALGVVLIELLTGRALLPGGVLVVDGMDRLVRERLESTGVRYPRALVELLVGMTAPELAERRATASGVSRELATILQSLPEKVSLAEFVKRQVFAQIPSLEDTAFAAQLTTSGRKPSAVGESLIRGESSVWEEAELLAEETVDDPDAGYPTSVSAILPKLSEAVDSWLQGQEPSAQPTFSKVPADVTGSTMPATSAIPPPPPTAPEPRARSPFPPASVRPERVRSLLRGQSVMRGWDLEPSQRYGSVLPPSRPALPPIREDSEVTVNQRPSAVAIPMPQAAPAPAMASKFDLHAQLDSIIDTHEARVREQATVDPSEPVKLWGDSLPTDLPSDLVTQNRFPQPHELARPPSIQDPNEGPTNRYGPAEAYELRAAATADRLTLREGHSQPVSLGQPDPDPGFGFANTALPTDRGYSGAQMPDPRDASIPGLPDPDRYFAVVPEQVPGLGAQAARGAPPVMRERPPPPVASRAPAPQPQPAQASSMPWMVARNDNAFRAPSQEHIGSMPGPAVSHATGTQPAMPYAQPMPSTQLQVPVPSPAPAPAAAAKGKVSVERYAIITLAVLTVLAVALTVLLLVRFF